MIEREYLLAVTALSQRRAADRALTLEENLTRSLAASRSLFAEHPTQESIKLEIGYLDLLAVVRKDPKLLTERLLDLSQQGWIGADLDMLTTLEWALAREAASRTGKS